jgi:glycosyltransferase involved in cell wall biosynthesis
MYRKNKISLVIPAYNEQKLIKPTLENVPGLIDRIYVVNDGSKDLTPIVVSQCAKKDKRIVLINQPKNMGVGQAIITGYQKSAEEGYDITVVVGGDFQMPLEQVATFLDPLVDGKADYSKGNRFLIEGNVFEDMPKIRQLGNALISLVTKIASGMYRIYDVVDGYTAITKHAIKMVNWNKAWKKYGYPMDFLIRLNAYGLRVKDIPRRAIYIKGERQSQIKGFAYFLKVTPMLLRGFFWRLFKKYLFRDFHPLLLFYIVGIILTPIGLIWALVLIYWQFTHVGVTGPQSTVASVLLIIGFLSLSFGMLFDMYDNINQD